MSIQFTDAELRLAVEAYCASIIAETAVYDKDHVFSDRYTGSMQKLFKRERRYRRGLRIKRAALTAAAVLVIVFGVLLVSSPTVYAAVRDWTVNIYNKIVEYTFFHAESDHSVIICDPVVPDGFIKSNGYHNGRHVRRIYSNAETGEQIEFEYYTPTEKQRQKIENRGASADIVTTPFGVDMYYDSISGKQNLFWYDNVRDLAFFISSKMQRDAFLGAFSNDLSYRLPEYGLTFLPEGYRMIDKSDYYPHADIIYYNEEADSYIILGYIDKAETDKVVIDQLGAGIPAETITMDGMEYDYYAYSDGRAGGNLVWIDEDADLVFVLEAELEKAELFRCAAGVECLESAW